MVNRARHTVGKAPSSGQLIQVGRENFSSHENNEFVNTVLHKRNEIDNCWSFEIKKEFSGFECLFNSCTLFYFPW
jgi:hypothetical protein